MEAFMDWACVGQPGLCQIKFWAQTAHTFILQRTCGRTIRVLQGYEGKYELGEFRHKEAASG